MKIGNTVFFGAMAAILMSTGANAAVTRIASTDYVDSVVGAKADASDVEALGTTVQALGTTVQTLGTTVSGLADDVDDINDIIGTGEMTVGGNVVDTIVNAINALDEKSVDAYTKTEANEKFATQEELGALAKMDTVGTDQIKDGAVTAEKLDDGLMNKINQETDLTGYATETWVGEQGYVTNTELTGKGYATETWVGNQNYIPKPSDDCRADSSICVLTIDKETGAMKWMNVTAPTAE